ncbi:MAG: MBL fold metallo-hydrolase [Crenarchaeota archaeon]|nr:MBL fold metallo-hydrolase [Thermoproteota archaeon]
MGLKVRIIGADSIGSRSMATVVEAGGVTIFIDPGVSYAPRRYGLPPHPRELQRLREIEGRIRLELQRASIVVVTHYHYDHYIRGPGSPGLYRGKLLLVKDPRSNINVSQRIRAHRWLRLDGVESAADRVEVLDGRRFEVDGVVVEASPPVPHGAEGTPLGYVVMVMVECCGERFIHASDVQGPVYRGSIRWIAERRPDILFISGPPTYFAGFKVSREEVERGLEGLAETARSSGLVIADHHFARDLRYPELLEELSRRSGVRLLSAAEYIGAPYEPLEALRRRLWEEEPPDSDRAS